MQIKITKLHLSGALSGLLVEDFYKAKGPEDARDFVALTEDLHLQYELSGGAEGWCENEDGTQFVYTSAVVCAEGRA